MAHAVELTRALMKCSLRVCELVFLVSQQYLLVLLTLTSILHAPSDQFSIADSWLKNAEDIHESTLQIFRVKSVCSNVFEGSFLVYFLHVRCVEKVLVVIRPGQNPPRKNPRPCPFSTAQQRLGGFRV